MMEFSLPEFFIFLGSTLLIALLMMELLDWSCILAALDCPPTGHGVPVPFHYGDSTGPEYWRCAYPESRGCEQSPVNIVGRDATVLAPAEPLRWRGYRDEPLAMNLLNDGNTVVVFGYWACGARPSLQGGPLCAPSAYEFRSAMFHWGPANDDGGSEHSLDYARQPLELQLVHVKRGLDVGQDIANCRVRDALAVVSYFFQITSADNPYLDHVVTNLWRVASPGTCVQVPAFPLEWLAPNFEHKYYSYAGSLTQPPCSQIVTWIVQPEPIAISASQMDSRFESEDDTVA